MVPRLGVSVPMLPVSSVDTETEKLKLLMEKSACLWAVQGDLAS